MKKSPKISEIKNWLIKNNPLDLFAGTEFTIKNIDPKPWSGHFNFLLVTQKQKFTLRFKGPEWGEPLQSIIDEYEILKTVENYKVGPEVYYLTRNFFNEPMLFEEYLIGIPLDKIMDKLQEKIFPSVAKFIAEINKIKLPERILNKQVQLFSYRDHKQTWRQRLKIILSNENTRPWGQKIIKIIPLAEEMLNKFEERLGRIMKNYGPVFIFRSAHIGHCLKTKDSLRFLNWEKNGFGDPGYSLAVFLASISKKPDFIKIKEKMIDAYLEQNYIPEFPELIEQRLKERAISDLLWVLWAYVNRKDNRPLAKTIDVRERFECVQKILDDYQK